MPKLLSLGFSEARAPRSQGRWPSRIAPIQDTAFSPDPDSNDDDGRIQATAVAARYEVVPRTNRPLACPAGAKLPTPSSRESAPILVAEPVTKPGPVQALKAGT